MSDFESYIRSYFDTFEDNVIKEAMVYAMDGGKRFRPRLIFSLCEGMGIEESRAYPCALALEMVQAYSLIHDDLPAMDNDDLRRGKPTLHKAFGEDIAILAGDALLTHSFGVIAGSNYPADVRAKMVKALSDYAGMKGMVYGQLLDITTKIPELDQKRLYDIQVNKTGGLFKIACLFAMYLRGEDREDYYKELGNRIGVIFQNQDDLFDIIRSEEEMGKSLSDLKNEKPSAIALYDRSELEEIIEKEFEDLSDYLKDADFEPAAFKKLIYSLKNR
ncbi:MAG: polyprenyl synthetase family protein [Erysipelotrichaceae bacterium]|nr:polyprenyl synthetase family protein [Erysipelotrichaceae bacterium]